MSAGDQPEVDCELARYSVSDLEPGVYTAAQVARLLGYKSVGSFNKLVASGEFCIPPLDMPGRRRWSRVKVDQFLAQSDDARRSA